MRQLEPAQLRFGPELMTEKAQAVRRARGFVVEQASQSAAADGGGRTTNGLRFVAPIDTQGTPESVPGAGLRRLFHAISGHFAGGSQP
jgi:hypothetical protein